MKQQLKQLMLTALVALCSITTFAHDFEVDGIYYKINDDRTSVSVTYRGDWYWDDDNRYTGHVTIPSSVYYVYGYGSYTVTSIGEGAFSGCSGLTYVNIPESVTSIENDAFSYCTGLTSVTIPNSVTSIGNCTFSGCYSLADINIPESVTSIGEYAFGECSSLTVPVYNTTVFAYMPRSATGYYSIPEGIAKIAGGAFSVCSNLTSVTIPNSVTSIGSSAFYGCTGLTSVTIPNSVTSIGSSAFDGTALYNDAGNWDNEAFYIDGCLIKAKESVSGSYIVKDGTRFIASYAFSSCSGLTAVTIPKSVTSIEEGTFSGCSNLTSVTIPEGVTNIGDNAFYGCSNLTSVTIPEGVTNIGDNAFYGCSNLTSVTIPNNVTNIGDNAFQNCSGLTSVTIPNNVTNIGDNAFSGCYNLAEINIPESVTRIGKRAFEYCRNLTTVNFNATECTFMGEFVFGSCPLLQTLNITNNVTVIPKQAFYACSGLTSVIIPNSVMSIGESAFSNCYNLAEINIPESVTSIGSSAFYGCRSLTSVIIPNSVMSIGESAFSGCSGLTSVTIPNSVTSIGERAFSGCSGLTSVTIPNSVTSIGSSAFSYCSSLAIVNFNAKNCTAMSNYYNDYVFTGCTSLRTLKIGANVTQIPYNVFHGCNSIVRIIVLSPTVSLENNPFYCDPLPVGRVTYVRNSSITASSLGTKEVYTNQIFTAGNFTYMITDVSTKTCRLISYDGEDTDVTVPTKVFYNERTELSVTGVRQSAFAYNSTVQSITFNNSGSIGAYACNECPALTSLTIGSGIKNISYNALDGTTSLTGVDVVEENETYCDLDGVICSKDGTRIVMAPKGITSYTIPNSVTSIADYAFQYCTALTGIEIPANVTSIGQYAFDGCTNMTTAEINASGSIGAYAFQNVTNLTNVNIRRGVTSIGQYAFSGCSNLETANINASGSIGDYAFGNLKQLSNVTILNATSIGKSAFAGASKLTELRIPHSVTAIGESAFSGCSSLETLYLGEHLTTIGKQAFLNCTKLVDITSTNVTPPTCASEAFSGVDGTLCEVNVRDEAVDAYSVAYGWKDFWWLQGYTINYIEKQPTSDDVSVVMHNTKEDVTYQWYSGYPLSLMGTGSYPWEEQPDGSWKSTNKGIDYSTSSMVIENLTVKSGDKLTFDYIVSSNGSYYGNLQVLWNGYTIVSDKYGVTSGSASYTFPSDLNGTLEFRYYKNYSSYGSTTDCATISNVKINGIGEREAIPGATDAELDLSTLSNIDKVHCIVTLSDGIQLTSNTVEVSTESKPTYSVASYKGSSTAVNSILTIDQIKALTLQDNEMVYVDAKIGAELPTNIVKKNGEGKWVAKEIELTDGLPFYNPSDVQAEVISYTRDFTTANWQALYVPFDVQYEDWADKADVAYINDVHQFDDDEDGRMERTVIEYLYKKSGSISANKPYLIRPKQTGEMTLTSHNTTLKATPATGGSVDCSSTTMLYTLTGTYQTVTDMYENHWYALAGGALKLAENSGVTLAPFRFYLNITDRDGNPVSDIDRPSYVRLMIGGLMIDEETGVEVPDANTSNADGRVYDLQGRRVETPKHGLYIIGGKKTIIK